MKIFEIGEEMIENLRGFMYNITDICHLLNILGN